MLCRLGCAWRARRNSPGIAGIEAGLPTVYFILIRAWSHVKPCHDVPHGKRRNDLPRDVPELGDKFCGRLVPEKQKGCGATMIKIAFCDDDLSVLDEINGLLGRYCALRRQELAYTGFHSPLELLAGMEKGMRWDILFLDIIMPGENGISVAKEIRQYDSAVKIIFLTSSSEFAVESYAVSAYFYQLKPIGEEGRFFRLMDAAISECEKAQQCSLVLRCKSGITRIDLGKLEYCEVIGRTLAFHMENGAVLENIGSLDGLCKKLVQYDNFLRLHRSYLVNMEYIRHISYQAALLESGAEIPIPHGKCSEMKQKYLAYAFRREQFVVL